MSPTEVAAAKLDDIMERFGEKKFDIDDLDASLDEKGPFQNSFLQEMEVMNRLLAEIVRPCRIDIAHGRVVHVRRHGACLDALFMTRSAEG